MYRSWLPTYAMLRLALYGSVHFYCILGPFVARFLHLCSKIMNTIIRIILGG